MGIDEIIYAAGEMYPPLPHPASWMAVARRVALYRIYVYCVLHECNNVDIWAKLDKNWPELFIAEPMHTFIHKCTVLLSAVDENKVPREHFFENLWFYLKTYDEVNGMGFQETDKCICNLIAIFRAEPQLVLNALLTLHAE
jgi:hypothetical protein